MNQAAYVAAGRTNGFTSHHDLHSAPLVFANRPLNMDSVRWIGFDMDYTLASYVVHEFDRLTYAAAGQKLVDKGYPKSILEHEPDPAFSIRGLIVDKALGNVLKMDRHGYVGTAYHGMTSVPDDTRHELYRDQRLGREKARFVAIDTFFNLPEVNLFAHLVTIVDKTPDPNRSYTRVWNDVRAAVDESHQDGTIKDHIHSDPTKYLHLDPDLMRCLHAFRNSGKRLFLLTNSDLRYTNHIMRYCLQEGLTEDWPDLFELIVADARKPAFFVDDRPLCQIDPVDGAHATPTYSEGSQPALQGLLACYPDEVLYVGDNIFADIVRSRKSSGWRTALIAPELEHDIRIRHEWAHAIRELTGLYEAHALLHARLHGHRHPTPSLELQVMLEEAHRVDVALGQAQQRVSAAFNPYWGSVFQEGYGPSRFAAQIEDYACVYTSRVGNLLPATANPLFIPAVQRMPHY